MEDKLIMETILTANKNICDLLLHGTLEASTPEVNDTFKKALNDCLDSQHKIYDEMTNQGWYKTKNVSESKITTLIDKLSSSE